MSHFDLYVGNFPYESVLEELSRQPLMWDRSPRVTFPKSPHREAQDIILRGPLLCGPDQKERPLHELHCEINCFDFAAASLLPFTMRTAEAMAYTMGDKELGRVILTKLQPSHCIWPHVDEGPVPEFYNRYHCVVQAGNADMYMIEDECMRMDDGQVWKVDVTRLHTAANMGDIDRIHLIVDIER